MKVKKAITVKELNAMNSEQMLTYATSLDANAIMQLTDDVFKIMFKNADIIDVSVNTSNRKASIYKYDDAITSIENKHEMQGIMKQRRQKLRKQLDKFVKGYKANINPIAKLKFLKEKDFITYYKTNYILNDYSIDSVCASHKDNESRKDIIDLMNFVKHFKSKI